MLDLKRRQFMTLLAVRRPRARSWRVTPVIGFLDAMTAAELKPRPLRRDGPSFVPLF